MNLKNHTYIYTGFGNIICYMLAVLLLGGCIDESNKNCPSPQVEEEESFLYLTVRDVLTNEDITETMSLQNVMLYLFDGDKKFLDRIEVSASQLADRTPINITDVKADGGYAVVWANVSEAVVASEPKPGQLMNELTILKQRDERYEDYYSCSGDLFYGYLPLTPDSRAENAYEVDVKRKNGRLHIMVRGMGLGPDTNPYDYYFRISTLNSGYDFEGNPVSGQTAMRAWPTLDENFNLVLAEPQYLVHSLAGYELIDEGFTICVVKTDDDRLGESELATDNKDEDGNFVTIESGKTTNVLFNFDAGGDLTVHVKITPWDEIYQWNDW